MDIGVITVRGSGYHPNSRLLEAAAKKGCSLSLVNPYMIAPMVIGGGLDMGSIGRNDLPRVILPRQGAQIGESSMIVLRQLAAMGLPLVNDVPSIAIARNKFSTLQVLAACGIRVPDSVFVNSGPMFYEGIERLGGFPVVAKKISGRQGRDVFLVRGMQDAEAAISKHLEPGSGIILQQFIANEGRRDLRVLVIGGNVTAAMELLPKPGDFRSNFHVSGEIRAAELSADIERIATASVQAIGLDIAGVDLIVDAAGAAWVVEVNYSPGFRGLEAVTGRDIAGEILDFAISFA